MFALVQRRESLMRLLRRLEAVEKPEQADRVGTPSGR